MVDVDVPIGPLWIRRQLFEHSVAIPLLTTSTASQIDFPRLSSELVSASVIHPPSPPAVTYDAWVAAAGLHVRLDSSDHAAIIVEALLTNAPDAFLRCNDPANLYKSDPVHYRRLIIPVPELLAFVKLHAAATISTNFRSFADAVWPDIDLPITQNQLFPHHQRHTPTSPIPSQSVPALPVSLTPASPRLSSSSSSPAQSQRTSPTQSANVSRPNTVESLPPFQQNLSNSALSQGENSLQSQGFTQSQSQPHTQPLQQAQHQRPNIPSNAEPEVQPQVQSHTQQHQQTSQSHPVSQLQISLQPTQQSQLQHASSTQGPVPNLNSSNGPLDSVVRKKCSNHISPMINSQSAIMASAQHALERETRLVIGNLRALLLVIASAYGFSLDTHMLSESPLNVQSGAIAVESGTLSNTTSNEVIRRGSQGSTFAPGGPVDPPVSTDTVMEDENQSEGKWPSLNEVEITREMFEHLSFLLTTVSESSGAFREMSTIVPTWSEKSNTDKVPLGRLVDTITKALTHVPENEHVKGVIDVIEVSDLERRTILQSCMPQTNTTGKNTFGHGYDVRVTNCNESHIYLLCSLGRVSCINCRGSTLFIGGCTSVSLINCENVRLHAVARVCRVTNCFDTHLYLCTNANPQIVGENRGLVFAPYNVAYSQVEVQCFLDDVGVDPNRNVWDKFFKPALRGPARPDRQKEELTAVQARVLAPEQFLPFGVPVRTSASAGSKDPEAGEAENGKGELWAGMNDLFRVSIPPPVAYAEQLKLKQSQILKVKAEVRAMDKRWASSFAQGKKGTEAGSKVGSSDVDHNSKTKDIAMSQESGYEKDVDKADGEGRGGQMRALRNGMVESRIQDRFYEWLSVSGRGRQVNDLFRLEQES